MADDRDLQRLYESVGLGGFVLCLMDAYTGARWSELVGQQSHEYNHERRDIRIERPLKEVGGKVFKSGVHAAQITERPDPPPGGQSRRPKNKRGRTKTPAGTRLVELPSSIAVFYEELMDSHRHPFVLCTPEGKPWRRSNFRQRYWRPAWDGQNMGDPCADDHIPAILPWFTFNEGRHTPRDVACGGRRTGGRPTGTARPEDEGHRAGLRPCDTGDAADDPRRARTRWLGSLAVLTLAEQARLVSWFPHVQTTLDDLQSEAVRKLMSAKYPHDH